MVEFVPRFCNGEGGEEHFTGKVAATGEADGLLELIGVVD